MLVVYPIRKLDNLILNSCRISVLSLIVYPIAGLDNPYQFINYVILVLFGLTAFYFTYLERFSKCALSPLYLFYTVFFLLMPMSFHVYLGDRYVLGDGLGVVIESDPKNVIFGQLFLLLIWVAGALALSVAPLRYMNKGERWEALKYRDISMLPLFVIGLIVIYFLYIDGLSYWDAKSNVKEKEELLGVFIFFDHAFLALFGIYSTMSLNYASAESVRRILIYIALVFVLFVVVGTLNGSKAAILGVFYLLFLFPFSIYRNRVDFRFVFFDKKSIVVLLVSSPILFYVVIMYRVTGEWGLFYNLSQIDISVINKTFDQIAYRLSWGGYDRYMILFDSFVMNEHNLYGITDYLPYVFKNFLNLVLPGTPYIESYAPSSQLFTSVIQHHELDGNIDRGNLVAKLNTQPYTIFGVFVIIAGVFSPILLFVWFTFLALMYRIFDNYMIKACMLYLFLGTLGSYGVEVVVANSIHLLLSMMIMYLMNYLAQHAPKIKAF